MALPIYCSLTYEQYKKLEEQFANYHRNETVHTTVDGYYHKAIRLDLGDVVWEFHGPIVKQAQIEGLDGQGA